MAYAHSHDAFHKPKRQQSVVDKVNDAVFSPACYQTSREEAARAKELRFYQAAAAQAPFASKDDGARFPTDVHWTHKKAEVTDKVNAGAELDLHAYSDSLASMARGREERFAKAASAPAPYAVLRTASAELGGIYPAEYVPLRPRRSSDMVKVNEQEFCAELYSSNLATVAEGKQARFERAAASEPPFAVGGGGLSEEGGSMYKADYHARARNRDVKGKVGAEEFDPSLYAANLRANHMSQADSRVRNHGVPGLLRQEAA